MVILLIDAPRVLYSGVTDADRVGVWVFLEHQHFLGLAV